MENFFGKSRKAATKKASSDASRTNKRHASVAVAPMCHPEGRLVCEPKSKFAQAIPLQRNVERSKPRSDSDEGIYEGVLLTFCRKVTFVSGQGSEAAPRE